MRLFNDVVFPKKKKKKRKGPCFEKLDLKKEKKERRWENLLFWL